MSNEKWSQKPIITNPTESARICLIDGSPVIENKTISIEDLGDYMAKEEVIDEVGKRSSISRTTINSGAAYPRKPVAVLSFDDVLTTDLQYILNVMDPAGLKGTMFLTSGTPYIPGTPLSGEQIKTLYNSGWDIASHSDSHASLGRQATVPTGVSLGSFYIDVQNPPYVALFKPKLTGTKFIIQKPVDPNQYEVISVGYELIPNPNYPGTQAWEYTLRLELLEATDFQLTGTCEIWLHEEEVENEVLTPIRYFESLGIPCEGFAYPFGVCSDTTKKIIQKYHLYARTANSGPIGITGGVIDYDELPFDQFYINATEIQNLSNAQMDTLIAEAVEKNALLVFLGHSLTGPVFQERLQTLVDKLLAEDSISIMTFKEAMEYHANAANFSTLKITKNGNIAGVTIPRGSLNASSSLVNYPVGISMMRVNSIDSSGWSGNQLFPTIAGTLITYKPNEYYLGSWVYQNWFDYSSNSIYYRRATSAAVFTPWQSVNSVDTYKELSCGSVTVPANSSVLVELTGKTDITGKTLIDSGLMNLYNAEVTPYAYEESWRLIYQPYVASGKLYVRIFNLLPAGNDVLIANLRLNVSLTKVG